MEGRQRLDSRVAERCVIAPLDLLQFVFVAQRKQRPLNEIHFLHFAHHIPVDAVHDVLLREEQKIKIKFFYTRVPTVYIKCIQ